MKEHFDTVNDGFTKLFKSRMLEITGIDYNHPPSEPPSQAILET
jgi:hypothetical protein